MNRYKTPNRRFITKMSKRFVKYSFKIKTKTQYLFYWKINSPTKNSKSKSIWLKNSLQKSNQLTLNLTISKDLKIKLQGSNCWKENSFTSDCVVFVLVIESYARPMPLGTIDTFWLISFIFMHSHTRSSLLTSIKLTLLKKLRWHFNKFLVKAVILSFLIKQRKDTLLPVYGVKWFLGLNKLLSTHKLL